MTRAEAEAIVAQVLQQIAPDAELATLNPGQDLRRALDLDSVDFLTALEQLAERTGVGIPEGAYGRVATFDGMVDYLMHPS